MMMPNLWFRRNDAKKNHQFHPFKKLLVFLGFQVVVTLERRVAPSVTAIWMSKSEIQTLSISDLECLDVPLDGS